MDHRLEPAVIRGLARRFAALTTDAPRQAIVDSLGNHPVNHARFAKHLADHHANDWVVYLALTRWMP